MISKIGVAMMVSFYLYKVKKIKQNKHGDDKKKWNLNDNSQNKEKTKRHKNYKNI